MPRAGLSRAAVVDAALAVVDGGGATGFADLTLAAVASRVGVAVPSLYKHVGGLPDLRRGVALVSIADLTAELTAAMAGQRGPAAVRAMATAVRDFAHRTPGRYAATQVATWVHDPASGELRDAGGAAGEAIAASLRELGLPAERTVDAVRVVRAGLHGFIRLELDGGFGMPDDVGASFDYLVATLTNGLR